MAELFLNATMNKTAHYARNFSTGLGRAPKDLRRIAVGVLPDALAARLPG